MSIEYIKIKEIYPRLFKPRNSLCLAIFVNKISVSRYPYENSANIFLYNNSIKIV